MIHDHVPYYFVREMVTLHRKSSLHYNVEEIARGYHTYQTVWVAVGDKLPCQREQANSEDPFAVAVTKHKLILRRSLSKKIFRSLLSASMMKWGQLCLWIRGSMKMHLAFQWRKKFSREEIFTTWHSINRV